MKLIYWKSLEILLKIDSISGYDSGAVYINESDLQISDRLTMKVESIQEILDEKSETESISLLEAIERDLA